MVMPVMQRCPECGKPFMGSDCIGSPCFDCSVKDIEIARRIANRLEHIDRKKAEKIEALKRAAYLGSQPKGDE